MSTHFAQNWKKSRSKVLVFGEKAVAQQISRELEAESFEPLLLSQLTTKTLPPIADPNSLDEIRQILSDFVRISGPQALVHPGVTVWAERPELPILAQELELTVISPPVRVVSLFNNRLNFLMEAERLGIPHLVQSFDPMHTVREIEELIQRKNQSFPFILKAVRGGGNFGMLLVQDAASLEKNVPLWCDQLRRRFGEVILTVERYLEGARHVAVPFCRFQDGRIQIFPISDTSLLSRYRKMIEFCPSSSLGGGRQLLLNATKRFAEGCGFVGVGVLEFLIDSSRAFLVDGLSRLNTGFHLWEKVAGTQAVSWQLATLESYRGASDPSILPENEWKTGISLRLCAEDSLLHLPQPGLIHEYSSRRVWKFPGTVEHEIPEAEAELCSSYEQGDSVRSSDSGILGILFVLAKNRKQCIALAQGVMNEIWIAGSLQTNERFLAELLSHPWVQEEIFHAGFVDEEFIPSLKPPNELLPVFAKVCEAYSVSPSAAKGSGTLRWAVGEKWIKPELIQTTQLNWKHGPVLQNLNSSVVVSGQIELDSGEEVRVCAFPIANRWQVRIGKWCSIVRGVVAGAPLSKKPEGRKLSALVTGRVHAILYRTGTVVSAHETLVIVESLGHFVPHALPISARILSWKVVAEDKVHVGQELALIEINGSSSVSNSS